MLKLGEEKWQMVIPWVISMVCLYLEDYCNGLAYYSIAIVLIRKVNRFFYFKNNRGLLITYGLICYAGVAMQSSTDKRDTIHLAANARKA